MREGFEIERIRRMEDYKDLEEKIVFKMEEGFNKETYARQQVQQTRKMQDSWSKRSWLS